MGGEFAAPSLKRPTMGRKKRSGSCMGGEFAAPSLKLNRAKMDELSLSCMGGEFAAPSLKRRNTKRSIDGNQYVWAANLPPPH